MLVAPLNLISTPVAVLNTLGLDLKVGLSSEDPMVTRHPSEAYEAWLSIYSPEGVLQQRLHLGQIPPNRRRFFDITGITRPSIADLDHLAVVHRIPSRLLAEGARVEDNIEMDAEPDYSFFRSVVQYSYPEGGNGSVIYETPPRFNAGTGTRSSNTLSFTCQIVLSESLNTHVTLVYHSVNPEHSRIARYNFGLYSAAGELVVADQVSINPFSVKVLDIARIIPQDVIEKARDPHDGIAAFTFIGSCDDAALMVLAINDAPDLGAVAVEHTHPPQTYVLSATPDYQARVKSAAQEAWRSILSPDQAG
jgi:hypothetical protein